MNAILALELVVALFVGLAVGVFIERAKKDSPLQNCEYCGKSFTSDQELLCEGCRT